ncbi:MAG: DUF58 domain-containing protein [Planctomycetota bacterium]|nr:DUF58 domain-containing protein [Planctomycetota bacterium]
MITEELMKKVRQLEIATRRSVSEVFAGEYSSAFRGRGMEFSEVREYQPGDDIRTIDWNVTARQNTPFVKRYVEERELTVMLAVDLSASGAFGSSDRTKREAAAELSGVVAFAATRNNDKVGLVAFTDRVELHVPPAKGTRHVLRIMRELLEFTPRPRAGTDPESALDFLGRVLRRHAIIFLVSDFLLPDAAWDRAPGRAGLETALRVMSRRHDVIAACMHDRRETALPPAGSGLIELQDAETGRRLLVDTSSRSVRRHFEEAARARRQRLAARLRRLGVDQLDVTVQEHYVHALIELFRKREKRR